MKKILLLTAICAATMVGCTNNEETPELQEMNFSPLSYKSTKAIINGMTYTKDDPSFGVFAYFSQDDDWKINGISAPAYFSDAQTISYNADGKIWKAATTSYWPLSGSLTFYAYSPSSVTAAVDANKVLTISDFEVSKTYANVNDQADLLYTLPKDATGLKSNSTQYNGVAGGGNGVPIVFRHALAQVIVNVKVKDTYTGLDFKVKSLKLTGMKDKATLSVTPSFNGTEESYTDTPSWGATSEAGLEQSIFSGESETLTTIGFSIGNPILVMPQTLDASTQKLEIEYQMTKTDVTPNVTSSTTKIIDLKNGTLTTLGMNKKITLNITISANEILYAPSVVDWESDSSVLPEI